MNVPIGAECFVPSLNTVIGGSLCGVPVLLTETHESIAVLERREVPKRIIGSPKPTYRVFYPCIITRDTIVPLVLVEVCEFVEFALYHGKITARLRFRAL